MRVADHSAPDFLAHREGDMVAVAVRDLSPGTVHGAYLDTDNDLAIDLHHDVPLGHKLALTNITSGDDVIEYSAG
jgi:(2R)-sulfolactate sulfo-lyase subunit alpha